MMNRLMPLGVAAAITFLTGCNIVFCGQDDVCAASVATQSPDDSPTPTFDTTETEEPTATPSPSPTATPTEAPTPTATVPDETEEPTATPSPSPTATPTPYPTEPPVEATPPLDQDGDGYQGGVDGEDCDDTDANVYPGAPEACDSVDSDCDGLLNEACVIYDDDADGDGFCENAPCADPQKNGGDCDDADPTRHPGATEICDSYDTDCDGDVDSTGGVMAGDLYYWDADLDGYGDDSDATTACSLDDLPPGYVARANDCDDSNPYTYPGSTEWYDGEDNDCNGRIDDDMAVKVWTQSHLEPLAGCWDGDGGYNDLTTTTIGYDEGELDGDEVYYFSCRYAWPVNTVIDGSQYAYNPYKGDEALSATITRVACPAAPECPEGDTECATAQAQAQADWDAAYGDEDYCFTVGALPAPDQIWPAP